MGWSKGGYGIQPPGRLPPSTPRALEGARTVQRLAINWVTLRQSPGLYFRFAHSVLEATRYLRSRRLLLKGELIPFRVLLS